MKRWMRFPFWATQAGTGAARAFQQVVSAGVRTKHNIAERFLLPIRKLCEKELCGLPRHAQTQSSSKRLREIAAAPAALAAPAAAVAVVVVVVAAAMTTRTRGSAAVAHRRRGVMTSSSPSRSWTIFLPSTACTARQNRWGKRRLILLLCRQLFIRFVPSLSWQIIRCFKSSLSVEFDNRTRAVLAGERGRRAVLLLDGAARLAPQRRRQRRPLGTHQHLPECGRARLVKGLPACAPGATSWCENQMMGVLLSVSFSVKLLCTYCVCPHPVLVNHRFS